MQSLELDLLHVFNKKYECLFESVHGSIDKINSPFNKNDITAIRYSVEGGVIDIWEDSPWSPRDNSVINFSVDDDKQGTGIGKLLATHVVDKYKSLSAQVTSLQSLGIFYKKGLRPSGMETSTLDDVISAYTDNGNSICMLTINGTDNDK